MRTRRQEILARARRAHPSPSIACGLCSAARAPRTLCARAGSRAVCAGRPDECGVPLQSSERVRRDAQGRADVRRLAAPPPTPRVTRARVRLPRAFCLRATTRRRALPALLSPLGHTASAPSAAPPSQVRDARVLARRAPPRARPARRGHARRRGARAPCRAARLDRPRPAHHQHQRGRRDAPAAGAQRHAGGGRGGQARACRHPPSAHALAVRALLRVHARDARHARGVRALADRRRAGRRGRGNRLPRDLRDTLPRSRAALPPLERDARVAA